MKVITEDKMINQEDLKELVDVDDRNKVSQAIIKILDDAAI